MPSNRKQEQVKKGGMASNDPGIKVLAITDTKEESIKTKEFFSTQFLEFTSESINAVHKQVTEEQNTNESCESEASNTEDEIEIPTSHRDLTESLSSESCTKEHSSSHHIGKHDKPRTVREHAARFERGKNEASRMEPVLCEQEDEKVKKGQFQNITDMLTKQGKDTSIFKNLEPFYPFQMSIQDLFTNVDEHSTETVSNIPLKMLTQITPLLYRYPTIL